MPSGRELEKDNPLCIICGSVTYPGRNWRALAEENTKLLSLFGKILRMEAKNPGGRISCWRYVFGHWYMLIAFLLYIYLSEKYCICFALVTYLRRLVVDLFAFSLWIKEGQELCIRLTPGGLLKLTKLKNARTIS